MSVDYRGLIHSPDDPTLQLIIELQKRLAKSIKDQAVELVDSDNEDIYADGQDVESVARWNSNLSHARKFNFLKSAQPPFEPDGNTVTVWLRGKNIGFKLLDISEIINGVGGRNHANIVGDPTLVDGDIDLGISTVGPKSIAMRLNRPTSTQENKEWLSCPDDTTLQFASFATGFSIFVRFRMKNIADQAGIAGTIFTKIDDSTPNNGVMLQVLSDGRLLFIVKKAGTTTAKYAAAGSIVTDTVYNVFVTFTVSGAVMKIYINGVDKTLTNFVGTVTWQDDLLNHDLYLFTRGKNTGVTRGCIYGDFYDFKCYRNRIVTQTEVTNHYLNKWSISNIGLGKVMIVNYFATGTQSAPGSFSSGSFSPGSFSTYP